MTDWLPQLLTVAGKAYRIRADFRNILRMFDAFADPALSDAEKAYICLKRLYCDEIPPEHVEEALQQANWFCDGGDLPKSEPEPVKMLDWKQDGHMLMPAVSRAAGVTDIRALPFLHWWTFLGLFGEVGEGLFSTVMHIRRKQAHGETLDKWERKFAAKNPQLIHPRSAEEQAEIDETEAFLNTIL